MSTLIIGCGKRPRPDCINLDRIHLHGVDTVFDLNFIGKKDRVGQVCTDGMPYLDAMFERVEAEDVLEHVDDIVAVVNDIWRVLKPEGILWVRGPDARYPEQVWADPTHKRAFAHRSFNGWDRSTHDGKEYGHYFHCGFAFFKVLKVVEKNKGLEYTLLKEQAQ